MNQEEKAFCERVTVAGCHGAKYHTFDYVETVLREKVPGDFVECGVMSGGHPAIAAYVFRKWGVTDRKIHLFDSFEGIPKAGPEDCPDVHHTYGTSGGGIEPSGKCASSIETILSLFQDWELPTDRLVFHKGWFEHTLEQDAKSIGPIAFFRVDVDLYSSTKVCYQHLYHKVSRSGIVVDDDWGRLTDAAPACRRAALSVIPAEEKLEIFEVQGNEMTSFWRKP